MKRLFLLVAGIAFGGFSAWGDCRYLSSEGDDTQDGLSPERAWRTLAKVARDLPSGGEIRLRRGDVYYGPLRLKSGLDAAHPTRVSVWGEGAKPVISLYKHVKPDPSVWTQVGDGLWRLDFSAPSVLSGNPEPKNNIGFIFADGVIHGFRKFDAEPLTDEWDYKEDASGLTVRLSRNPAEAARDIRFAPRVGGIPFVRHAVVESVVVRGTGAHGANGTGAYMVFRDCEFREIGGSELSNQNGKHVRYGNGVECWAGSTEIQVENCFFSDIYDVAFTMQGRNPRRSWENVKVVGCRMERCTQAFEVWASNCQPGIGMKGCRFEKNTIIDSGYCWGYDTRPNKSCSAPLLMYGMQTDVCDILVTDNDFINNRQYLVYKSGGIGQLPPDYRIVGNRVKGPAADLIGNRGAKKRAELDAAREKAIREANAFEKTVPFDRAAADRVAAGHVCEVSIPWHFPLNRIDWLFNPTKAKPPFNPEWTWQLNRTGGWGTLADAYRATGDEAYARAFVVQLRDWLDQTGGVPPEKGYNGVGSPWRTIEEGIRLMGPWPKADAAFKDSPSYPKDLRERFLRCMKAQAAHLMVHRTTKNWLLMEMTGVYTVACRYPEFPESAAWRRESAAIFSNAIRSQILPDGLHDELSPDYHLVFYRCASALYDLAKKSGFAHELPADFLRALEAGAEGALKMMTPGFVQPRFNDCYTIPVRNVLEPAAKIFPARKDFLWAATEGRSGEPPSREPTASRYLPFAGFAVMRSGWSPNASYLAFDVGPLGMGHFHQDKLSFTIWKGNEELLFDDGGGQYENSAYRRYGLSGYDHNTLIVDGLAQRRKGPMRVDVPIDAGWKTTAERDYAFGVYDQGFGPQEKKLVIHRREIEFAKREDFFTVTDTVTAADGQAHDCELLFQVDTTNVTVEATGRRLLAKYGRKWDLSIEIDEGSNFEVRTAKTEPQMAGWFVGRNDLTLHPATTVAVKKAKGENVKFITIFRPVRHH